MRVLHVVKGLGPGGAEHLLLSIASTTDPSRAALQVAYLLPWKQHLVSDLHAVGCPTHLLGGSRGFADPRWPLRLRRLAGEHDVVHIHSPALAAVARPLLRTVGPSLRVVTTEHNLWASFGVATKLGNALTAPLDHHRFAVSGAVRASMARPWRRRTEVLEQGVLVAALQARRSERVAARAALGAGDDEVVVVTVANLRPQKDYPTLFAAAASALVRQPRLRFVTIGQGPLEDELRAALRGHDLGDRFQMLGYHPDPLTVLVAADIFALSSRHEGLPLALMEALAVGVAPVVTAVGGLTDVIDHDRNGLLVAPEAPGALADALVSLAEDPRRRARLAAGAAATASRFDIARVSERLTAVYEALHVGRPVTAGDN